MLSFWIVVLLISAYQHTNAKQCSSPGKYPQDQPGNCGGYALCLMSGPDTFTQYNLTCPPGFIYNHMNIQCTNETGYHCAPDFNCTDIGLFPDPSSDNCTTYVVCIEGLNDVMTARTINCPTEHIFNPMEKSCVNVSETSFKCSNEQSTEAPHVIIHHVLESTNNAGVLATCQVIIISLTNLLMFSMFN